jgi:hypothetical protein
MESVRLMRARAPAKARGLQRREQGGLRKPDAIACDWRAHLNDTMHHQEVVVRVGGPVHAKTPASATT